MLVLKSNGTVWATGYNYDGELGNGGNADSPSYTQVSSLRGITAVAAGGYSSFALKSNGTVWAWGYGSDGEMGNGTNTSSKVPVQVSTLSGIIAIAAGQNFCLALKSDGTVWTWGYGIDGELGNAANANSNIPVQVSGLSGVVAIACGDFHAMAIKSNGTECSWGNNSSGQLGNGTTSSSNIPVAVSTLTGVTSISGGIGYSIASKSDGTVYDWGVGYLGDGVSVSSSTPILVPSLTKVVEVSDKGDHSVVLKADGTLWSWGVNNYGQLANGVTTDSSLPVQVVNLTGIAAVASGGSYNLALKSDGSLWGWGYNIDDSNIGAAGAGTQTNVPTSVTGLASSYTAIAAAKSHYLALKSDGTVWTWDDATPGQVSNGTTVAGSYPPIKVSGLSGTFTAVACGAYFNLALKNDGTVWAWGQNGSGQLGNATNYTDNQMPAQVSGLSGITAIACGAYAAFALKNDGTVWSWGENGRDELGTGTGPDTNVATQISSSSLSGITAITSGAFHPMALKNDGTVWTWGVNTSGELGNGTFTSSATPIQVTSLSGTFTAIAAGYRHSMALRNDGTVWAWGDNQDGQLGNQTATSTTSPVQVSILTSVTAISAGENSFHSLAVKSDGTVWAWGDNTNGELGLGVYGPTGSYPSSTGSESPIQISTSYLSSPTQLASGKYSTVALKSTGAVVLWGDSSYEPTGFSVPVQVPFSPVGEHIINASGGEYHSLLIESDGSLWGWGDNAQGQLGDGTTTNRSSPVLVSGLSNVSAVAAGGYHSLAVKADGSVWAWGDNVFGQLGDGTVTQRNAPVSVSTLSSIASVAAGYMHSMALKSDGTVVAWGYNGDGELGDGTTTNRLTPVAVSGLTGIKAIAVRGYHSLALKSDGTIWTWGYNGIGELGDGTTTNRLTPVQVTGISTAVFIAGGGYFSSAIEDDGSVWTWGDNTYGQLGDGTTTGRLSPYQVQLSGSPLNNAIALASGDNHLLVLRADGTMVGFGANYSGQLGDGGTGNQLNPEILSSFSGIASIAAGGIHSFAAASAGNYLMSWGDNSLGQLGYGTIGNSSAAQNVASIALPPQPFTVVKPAMAAGGGHALALKNDGTVWTLGSNGSGQLGNGTTTSSKTPVQVLNLASMMGISGGDLHSLAVRSDGTVWSWGDNTYGELGDETTTSKTTAAVVPNFRNVIGISAGNGFSLAVKADGTAWAWGNNGNGQLGNGGTSNTPIPGQVSTVTGVIAVAAGADHSLFLKNDGSVWAVGYNGNGAIGDGTTTNRLSPVQVSTTNIHNIVSIACGQYSSYALRSDGSVWAWGYNFDGEIGNGSHTNLTSPVQVLTGVKTISAGYTCVVAIKNDGTIYTWGNGPVANVSSPTLVSGTYSFVSVAAGNGSGSGFAVLLGADNSVSQFGKILGGTIGQSNSLPTSIPSFNLNALIVDPQKSLLAVGDGHSEAVRSDGSAWGWGSNNVGQLGNSSIANSNIPVQLSNFSSGASASAGTGFSGSLKSDGTLWTWGINTSGQLGDATTISSIAPVLNSQTGLLAQVTGSSHTIIIKGDRSVWCAGNNASGQLGNNSVTSNSSFVQITSTNFIGGAFQVAGGSLHSIALRGEGGLTPYMGHFRSIVPLVG